MAYEVLPQREQEADVAYHVWHQKLLPVSLWNQKPLNKMFALSSTVLQPNNVRFYIRNNIQGNMLTHNVFIQKYANGNNIVQDFIKLLWHITKKCITKKIVAQKQTKINSHKLEWKWE